MANIINQLPPAEPGSFPPPVFRAATTKQSELAYKMNLTCHCYIVILPPEDKDQNTRLAVGKMNHIKEKKTSCGASPPEAESWFLRLPNLGPCAGYLISLCLCFHVCKIELPGLLRGSNEKTQSKH